MTLLRLLYLKNDFGKFIFFSGIASSKFSAIMYFQYCSIQLIFICLSLFYMSANIMLCVLRVHIYDS
jgi:hypothetical protein